MLHQPSGRSLPSRSAFMCNIFIGFSENFDDDARRVCFRLQNARPIAQKRCWEVVINFMPVTRHLTFADCLRRSSRSIGLGKTKCHVGSGQLLRTIICSLRIIPSSDSRGNAIERDQSFTSVLVYFSLSRSLRHFIPNCICRESTTAKHRKKYY